VEEWNVDGREEEVKEIAEMPWWLKKLVWAIIFLAILLVLPIPW